MSDWQTAQWADGPAVAAWLDDRVKVSLYPDRVGRAIARWRNGARAEFYAVDRVLVAVGLHPQDLPQSCWTDEPPANRRALVERNRKVRNKLSPEAVRDIRVRVRCGAAKKELARVYGVHPKTIRNVALGRTWQKV